MLPVSRCISFVVLSWNSGKYIEPCVRSVLSMPYCRQIFVVDNGSTDDTQQRVKCLQKDHPEGSRIVLLANEKNLGTTLARNQALRQIGEDVTYVCILDSDTEVNASAFEAMLQVLEAHEDCMLAGPALVDAHGLVQSAARCYPGPVNKLLRAMPFAFAQRKSEQLEHMPGSEGKEPYQADYLMSACWLLKREALTRAGLLDEKIFFAPEDVEYCTRLRRMDYTIFHCPQVSILHHWQRISKKKLLSYHNIQHIKGLLYLWRKYGIYGKKGWYR